MTNNFKRLFLYSTAVIMFSSSNALAAKGDFTNFFKALRNNSYNGMVYNFDSSFVNAKDTSGKTPLGYALSHNNANMTEFLLRNGANPSTIEANGEPAFCNAKHTRNAYIKKQLNGYNFEVCKGTFFSPTVKTVGGILLVGGAVAAAAGGGGGGGGSGGGSNATVYNSEYGLVGGVDQTALNNIISSPDYSNVYRITGGRYVSNSNDYNQIRLAYALARGFTGRYTDGSTSPSSPSSFAVGDKVKVAVLDTGVQATNNELSGNVITGLNNSNLAYLYCMENPSDSKCVGTTYNMDDASPYSTYTDDNSAWHGTAVAGVIAAKFDGQGITGVAPDAAILPYRITFDEGVFVSNYYIGEAFKSAADNGAVVINNSWGIPTKDKYGIKTVDAGDITSQSYIQALFSDYTHGSNYSNFIDQMLYAVNQKDTIFVFSTGNNGTDQPSITTSIPLFFDDFKDGEYYKNFIAVVAYDTANETIANYSNKCGVAKEFCITAPGTEIIAPVYESGNPANDINYIVSGTSFSAPMVSGAVALLKGAFPYLTGAEISKLIFVTARDLGDPGVDEVYGWGMLDVERATRPVGATIVPVDSRIDGRNYSISSSTLKLNSRIANNVKEQNLTYVFLDDFNRTFTANLNDKIEVIKDRAKPIDMLNRFGTNKIKPINFEDNKALGFYSSSETNETGSEVSNQFKISYNTDNVNNSGYGFSFYYGNNPYNTMMNNDVEFYNGYALSNISNYNAVNPYFRNDSKENFGFNNKFFLNNKISFGIGMIYQDYTLKTENDNFEGIMTNDLGSSMSLISSITYSPIKDMATTVEFGFINEKKTLFGSKTGGAFGIGNDNNTYMIGLQNDVKLYSKLSMFGRMNFGYTKVNNSQDSLITDVSDLYTNSFALGMNYNLLNEKTQKSNISFMIGQSVNINSGNMSLRLPTHRDDEGNLYYDNRKISLKDKANIEYQLSYNYETIDNSEFNIGLVYSNYSDGYKDKDEGIILLKYRKAF